MFTFKDFGITVIEAKLSNDVPVLLFKKKGMPIHTEIRFASGSRFDPTGKEGLAHFVEHMIVAGSTKFPSKDKMAMYIENLGGVFKASTSVDALAISVEVASKEDFTDSVLLLREMLTESLFDDKVINTERKAIFKEIDDKLSNPDKFIWSLHSEVFFQGTEVGKSTLGTKESLELITREDLVDYAQNMLVSGRAIVAVCGDIEIDQIVGELEKNLLLRISDKYTFGSPLPIFRGKSTAIQLYQNQKQVQLIIGFRTRGIKDPGAIPLRILATIFGAGRASVLTKRLRYEKGLVYSVGASSFAFSNGGAWSIKTSTAKEKLQEVVDIITEEFTRIASGGVTEEELEFAKNKITKSSRRQMQTAASWVSWHIGDEFLGNAVRLPEYLNIINSTKKAELSQVGEQFFKPGLWYLAMCGDVDETSVTVNY